jgi:shikimate kinase
MEYEEIMDMVTTEMTERSIHRQREENKEIDQLIKRRVALAEEMQTYVAGVDSQLKKILEDYLDIIDDIYTQQTKYSYLQGAKDCARLLKSLELL